MEENKVDNSMEKKDKESKKKVLIPIIVVIVILCVIGVVVAILLNKQNSGDEYKEPEYEPIQMPQEDLTEEEHGNILNDILLIGIDIYDSGKYLELPKSDDVGYFATVSKLKEMGYTNIDKLLHNCSDGHAVIFFDVEHMENYIGGYPILTVHNCEDFWDAE